VFLRRVLDVFYNVSGKSIASILQVTEFGGKKVRPKLRKTYPPPDAETQKNTIN